MLAGGSALCESECPPTRFHPCRSKELESGPGRGRHGHPFDDHAEARLALYKKIHGCTPGAELPHSTGKKPPTAAKEVPAAAKSEQEERLRPGRVAVRGEQAIRLESLLREVQEAMAAMKGQLIAAKLPGPPVPDISALVSPVASVCLPSSQGPCRVRNP